MDTEIPFEIKCVRDGVAGGGKVTLNGRPLPLHLNLCNHSPDGFNWSYGGSGPAQLAFCIVLEYLMKVEGLPVSEAVDKTHAIYQNFKWSVIARLKNDTEILSKEQIKSEIEELETSIGFGV